jgi:hypothetical protein
VSDVESWDEITIRTPGWRAKPDQVADFLRAVFPEDVILPYQQRVAEAGMRETVGELRAAFEGYVQANQVPKDMEMLFHGVLNMIDPDSKEFDGYFPSKLVCPHHGGPETRTHSAIPPLMKPCPGYPHCRAGMDIRESSR